MNSTNLTPEAQELIKILDGISVLNVYAVRFYPSQSSPFNVMTTNMKKIALVVIWKNNKTEFLPKELLSIFERIKTHLPDNLGQEKRKIIENAVERFVMEGGKVEIVTRFSRTRRSLVVAFFSLALWIWFLWIVCGWFIMLLSNNPQELRSFITYAIGVYMFVLILYFIFIRKIQIQLKQEAIDVIPDSIWKKAFKLFFILFIIFGPGIINYITILFIQR